MSISHNMLASTLADQLKTGLHDHRVVWENMAFQDWKCKPPLNCRPDVFSIRPALDPTKCRPWVHEVKATRNDFFSDIRSGKWKQYRSFACRVFFAVPKGLVEPYEVPIEAGLWEYDAYVPFDRPLWRMVRQGKACRGWELTPRHLMKMILGRWGTYASLLPNEEQEE